MKIISFLMSKFSIYFACLGIIMGLVLLHIINQKDPEPQPLATPAINPFMHAIAASGIIESYDRNISVGNPVAGLVKKIFVKVGDLVEKDQILFEIDDRELQAELLTEKANVAVSEANVLRLQDQLERLKSVTDLRAVSVDEVKTRQNDVIISLAQLEAARARVQQTELLIARYTIKAPRAGVILQNNIREGEFLALNSRTTPILLGDARLQIRADIDEQNASDFKSTQIAVAYPKNNTTLKIPLVFDRIEPYVIPKRSLTGTSDERVDTRVLQVIYSFEEPKDFHVYVGQQVDVFIEKESM